MFCWERASQLKRDALPVLDAKGVKLFAVGIGSLESARTFCQQTGFPLDLMLVDDSDETDAYASVGTRNTRRDNNGKLQFEGIQSMWSKDTTDAIKARGRDDLNAILRIYKPLQPSSIDKTLVQGGSFIFDGSKTLLAHYDQSSGAHLPIETLIQVATA